jgi:hypothetical protein
LGFGVSSSEFGNWRTRCSSGRSTSRLCAATRFLLQLPQLIGDALLSLPELYRGFCAIVKLDVFIGIWPAADEPTHSNVQITNSKLPIA